MALSKGPVALGGLTLWNVSRQIRYQGARKNMKMKTAHIFLAAASMATLTVLAGCGTNNANEISSPGYNLSELVNAPTVVGLAITPQTASGHVGQDVQLQATGTLSNGQTADITQFVNWTSSNPAVARISATGLVSARDAGTVTITATRGSFTSTIQFTVNPKIRRIFVSNKTSNSIQVFDFNDNGNVNPVHSISGARTGLNAPGQMQFLDAQQELFVANTAANEIDVFYLQAEGNVAPLRKIKTAGMTAPTGIALNPDANELVVLAGQAIRVYNLSDTGDDVTPKRTITGGLTGLATTENAGISLTSAASTFPSAILVPNGVDVRAFPISGNGDIAPTKILTGPAALIKTARSVANVNNIMIVSDPGAAVPAVYRWAVTDNTVAPPTATLTDAGNLVNPLGLLPVAGNNSVWVVDGNNRVALYPAAGAPATRAFTSAALAAPSGIVIADSF